MRRRYRALLTDLAAAAGDDHLFRPDSDERTGKNAVSNLVTAARRGGNPDLPRLTPQRMRATWLVRHLNAGVRPDVLLRFAGLDDLGSLDRYLRHLAPITDGHAAALLLAGDA